jgi:hypothetical protein
MTHDNSPAKCMNKCSENNFKYAGVQYNYQCWCGNSYGNFGPAFNCHMNCPNNTVDYCGGAWSNDIYEIVPNNLPAAVFISKNETTICENQLFKFNCPTGYVISVIYAMYGRISITKCQTKNYFYDKCNMIETDSVGKACNNLNSCKFMVDNYVSVNDPCQGYSKYLDVSWGCTFPNLL